MPGVEALACCRPAEGDDVPVEQPRIAFQLDDRAQLGLRCGIDNGLLRQPFQRGTGLDAQLQVLKGRAGGAIPLGCTGAGQLRPGAGAERDADVQPIPAGDAARGVDDDVLADFRPFGIQMLLHP